MAIFGRKTENPQPNYQVTSSYVVKRTFSQIIDTIHFEMLRNWRKTVLLLGAYTLVFVFFYYLNVQVYSDPTNLLPSNPNDYIAKGYMLLIPLMVFVLAAAYGASIITEDYEKQTGNLVFPNTTKFRLLSGRFTAALVLGMLSLIVYYVLIAVDVFFRYNQVPIPTELWVSLGWAILYLFLLLSFVTFVSSFMRSTALVIILAFVFVLVVSVVARRLIIFTGYTGEPYFIISYFGDIISNSLDMPATRSEQIPFGNKGRLYTN